MTEPTKAVRKAAERARAVGEEIAQLVHDKQIAYGDAAGLQAKLWEVLLEPYRSNDGHLYIISRPFMLHSVPRLTRVFDRIARITAGAGEDDPMGEEPWRDLAGDAIVGASIQPTDAKWRCPWDHPVTGAPCMREDEHDRTAEHRSVHAGGVQRWQFGPAADGPPGGGCGALHGPTGRRCTRRKPGGGVTHRHYAAPRSTDEHGLGWWDDEGTAADPRQAHRTDIYTHGYVPEEGDS